MNIYTAPHVSGAPDWSAVPSAEIGNLLWTESCGVRAWAQLCWTEEALHLRLRAAERDIRAEERGLLGMPCRDSCLEFFFCPSAGDLRYFNIEFSPSGCMYLGFGRSIEEHSRLGGRVSGDGGVCAAVFSGVRAAARAAPAREFL